MAESCSMKKLILLRHAKSSWDNPVLEDHDRPLNKRGRSASPVIGAWLTDKRHMPDKILCSTATRARQTLKGLELPEPALESVEYLSGLYHACPETMLEILRGTDDKYGTAMIIGHQPGLSAMARLMSDHASARCKRAFEHFPTAAAAVLEGNVTRWKDLGYGLANFVDFAKPRELMDA